MKRAILSALVMVGCVAPRAVETKPQPGLMGEPTRPQVRTLPAAIDVDPLRTVPTQPLTLTLREPEVVTLANGLPVYLMADHATPLVLMRVLTPVGAVDDPNEKLGLAGVTTALMLEGGAGSLAPEALDAAFEVRAADLSGGAGDETSSFSLSMRSEDVPLLTPLFADVIQRPRFDEKRFQVIVSRSLESVRRREDRPDGVAARALTKAVFGPQSLLGRESTETTLKAITVADVKKFHQTTWGQGARLIVTGDFDRATLLPLLEKTFGGWKGGAAPTRTWPKPERPQARVIVVPRKIAQAKVRLGTWGYARRSPDEYPLRLLSTSLGAFGVGRLYREIRDERGLAYSAFASAGSGPTTGTFTAGFDTRPEQVGEALEVALRIMKESGSSQPISNAELTVAREMAVNAFAFRFEGVARIAWERASLDLFDFPKDYLSTWRDRTTAVRSDDLARAARSLEGLQIVIVGPVEKMGDLSRFGAVTTIADVEAFR